jgi:hypothetical protein
MIIIPVINTGRNSRPELDPYFDTAKFVAPEALKLKKFTITSFLNSLNKQLSLQNSLETIYLHDLENNPWGLFKIQDKK